MIQFEIDEFDEIKTFSAMKTFGPIVCKFGNGLIGFAN
jgi:hypothetical protein